MNIPAVSVIDSDNNLLSGSGFEHTLLENTLYTTWDDSLLYIGKSVFRNKVRAFSAGGGVGGYPVVDSNLFTGIEDFCTFLVTGSPVAKFHDNTFYNNSNDWDGTQGILHFRMNDSVNSKQLTVEYNYFLKNAQNNDGSAIFVGRTNTASAAVTATFNNNYFGNNQANLTAGVGGAIHVNRPGLSLTANNNTFVANQAQNGAGLYSAASTSITFNKNYLSSNTATTNGGGVSITGSSAVYDASHNNYLGNSATTANNWFNAEARNHNLSTSYFGGGTDTSCPTGKNSLGVVDSCQGGGGSGSVDLSGTQSSAWPLCTVSPTDSNCVGANM